METLGNKPNDKNETYFCNNCDFKCRYASDWNRHKTTRKHIYQAKSEMVGNEENKGSSNPAIIKCLSCEKCNKEFKTNSGLWKHKKQCSNYNINEVTNETINDLAKKISDKDELIMFLIKENAEFKNIIVDQQKQQNVMLMEIMKNNVNVNTNNSNNTTNNSHNKAFNLQFFLNETCKDAMNIGDFVNSIKLQLSDLENIGEIGYVEGISNIITSNLKALDVTQRPVHCTDKKRETMYIKDENKWAKENEDKPKLRKAIKNIANKNIRLLSQFREKYPDYCNSSLKISDTYDKIVIEAMTTDVDKDDKIIRKISGATIIDKILE
jgi:hypothetical protein